jgi:hypothetical protein
VYSNNEKFTVKQRVCKVALDSILKLDRAERHEGPVLEIERAAKVRSLVVEPTSLPLRANRAAPPRKVPKAPTL